MHPSTSTTTRRRRDNAGVSLSTRVSREELLTDGDGKRLISLKVAAGDKYDSDSDLDLKQRPPR